MVRSRMASGSDDAALHCALDAKKGIIMTARFDYSGETLLQHPVSRRRLLRAGLTAPALLPLASWRGTAAQSGTPAAASMLAAANAPATWRTWLLSSADELRPAAPGASTQDELDEVLAMQASPTEAMT